MTSPSDISLNGSCWDDGPTLVMRGECDPMPPKCELHAGHLGAHRSGRSEWMRNPSSYRQVSQERDEALADLARALECIAKVRAELVYSESIDGAVGTEYRLRKILDRYVDRAVSND